MKSKCLDSLSEGTYVSTLFWTVVRELYLDTERPIEFESSTFDQLELEEREDEEKRLQRNVAFVLSQALNYASALVRYMQSSKVLTSRNEWFDIRDRILQERVQKLYPSRSPLIEVTSPNTFPIRSSAMNYGPWNEPSLSRNFRNLMTKILRSAPTNILKRSTRGMKLMTGKNLKCRYVYQQVTPWRKWRLLA